MGNRNHGRLGVEKVYFENYCELMFNGLGSIKSFNVEMNSTAYIENTSLSYA